MGVPRSGAVAGACLWEPCEDGLINNASYLESCGVEMYLRFIDDVWIWARAASGGHRCAIELMRKNRGHLHFGAGEHEQREI